MLVEIDKYTSNVVFVNSVLFKIEILNE
jgi:hypothetical protein